MPDKYLELEYRNFSGLNTQDQPISVPNSMLVGGSTGYLARSGVLYSQPAIKLGFNSPLGTGLTIPAAPDGNAWNAIGSFIDSNNITHTIGLTSSNCYQLNFSGSSFAWSLIGSIGSGINSQYAIQAFTNQLYFCNGNVLYFVDGLTGTVVQTATSVCGGRYLTSIANSLILGYTLEGSNIFPQRVRWSAPNQPTQWDPSSNVGAGFNTIQDLADGISGIAVIGTNGYIFSPSSITVMSPTGNNQLPFTFDHLWYSPRGIGCAMPQSLDSYGPHVGFVAVDGIYILTVSGVTNIGDKIIDNFFDSVFNSQNTLQTFVFGKFIPVFMNNNTLRVNLMYNIYIVQQGVSGMCNTKVYSYSMDSKAWSIFSVQNLALTCKPDIIAIG